MKGMAFWRGEGGEEECAPWMWIERCCPHVEDQCPCAIQ